MTGGLLTKSHRVYNNGQSYSLVAKSNKAHIATYYNYNKETAWRCQEIYAKNNI